MKLFASTFRIFFIILFVVLGILQNSCATTEQDFLNLQNPIVDNVFLALPIQDRGRIKPFDTFANETILFLTGRYSNWNLSAAELYLKIIGFEQFEQLELIEVRSTELRKALGLEENRRRFSLLQLSQTRLSDLAQSLMLKLDIAQPQLDDDQKSIMETYHQCSTLRQISSGEHLEKGLNLDFLNTHTQLHQAIEALKLNPTNASIQNLQQVATEISIPKKFETSQNQLRLELLYNHLKPFSLAALGYFLFALMIFLQGQKIFFSKKACFVLISLPLSIHLIGFVLRVIITGFAPVTNMYGTMIWVSFGIMLFNTLLYLLYSNFILTAFLSLVSAAVLVLTESWPLILHPEMDPITAVLRSNYWLSIHVLTITISYASLSIAMLLGNAALLRELFFTLNENFYSKYAHYVYRMIQLGCFLLTTGIILGGIWADYSWGRFWGWDPKETWALIADLGFIALLHAKYIGWLKPFSLLAWSTMAYLLVIMAWYGVNFVLGAGLHSYGFSSGGNTAIMVFLSLQLGLFFAALMKRRQLTR